MLRTGCPQSVVVTGESGSGKSEVIKLCLSSISEVSVSGGRHTECALEANALLEAFGNAATGRNTNASRFGAWTAIEFGTDGRIGRYAATSIPTVASVPSCRQH